MNKNKTRAIASIGMLSALAVVLQYIEIAIPIMPSFVKLDFSDLPELIGAFALGPVAGILITVVKNIIHILVSQSLGVGELSNCILGCSFAATAGLIYKANKDVKHAIIAGVCGSVVMAAISFPLNYWLIYPLYYNVMGFPEVAILGMYQALLPSVQSMPQALLIFNVPFTLIKGLICVFIAMWIYKPISHILKRA